MAGAGYKLFVSGDVLTAAQVNTYLNEQTVMVFATSAARTSALSLVLAEGMMSYLQDSNTVFYYDGAAWNALASGDITAITAGNGISVTSGTGPVPTVAIDTAVTVDKTTAQTLTNKTLTSPALTTPTISTLTTNGDLVYGTGSGALSRLGIGSSAQVLTVASGVPSWATPAAASGDFVKISSVAWTAAGAQSLTSVFSATYDDYCIVFDNMVGTAAANAFSIRMRSGGTNDTNSTYYYASMGLEVGGTATNINGSGVGEFRTAGLVESPHVAGLVIWIFNPYEAVRTSLVWQIFGNTSTNFVYRTGGGLFAANTVFDGLGFFLAGGGNISGDATVYGLKK